MFYNIVYTMYFQCDNIMHIFLLRNFTHFCYAKTKFYVIINCSFFICFSRTFLPLKGSYGEVDSLSYGRSVLGDEVHRIFVGHSTDSFDKTSLSLSANCGKQKIIFFYGYCKKCICLVWFYKRTPINIYFNT